MYLKRLEMQGFKSFADKTVLEFMPGITSVIGPNGSGKSNISDCIRWILGEQSMKSLRGQKTQDIIFAGTQNRKSLGFAEASLIFDNTDGVLPIEYTEVTITRKIYRSGETGYFINKVPCRLKDVVELFMDTGIGRDGYSIIGQGKIDEILSNKSEDRRHIFEEAAGIVKYRARKDETEKKLEQTKLNLLRINDILTEIEGNLEPLQLQSDKAKKYLNLKEELKKIEIGLFIYNIEKNKQILEELIKDEEIMNSTLNQEEGKNERIKILKEQLKEEIDEITSKIEGMQNIGFESQKEIEQLNSEINVSKARIENNIENKKIHEEEIKQIEEKIRELKDECEKKSNKKESLKDNKEKFERELKEKEEKLEKITKKLSTKELEIEKIKKLLEESTDQKYEIQSEISMQKANIENIEKRQGQIKQEINSNIMELDRAKIKKEDISKGFYEIENTRNKVVKNIEEINHKKEEIDRKSKEYDTKIMNLTNDLRMKQSRHNFLVETEKEKEGYIKSVKDLLLDCEKDPNLEKGMHGTLANIISVPQEYSVAIEMCLGASIQNIVTETEQDAKKLVEHLRKNKLGRASFLPISSIKGRKLENIKGKKEGFIGIASDLVIYGRRYEQIILNLLGRTVIIDNMKNAIELAKENNYSFRIVTLEGDIINASGAITGGSVAKKTVNILGRSKEIEELKREIKKLNSKIEELEKEKEEFLNMSEDTFEEIELLEKQLQETEIVYATEKQRIVSIDENIEKIQKRIEHLKNEEKTVITNKQNIEKDKKENEEKIEKINVENIERQKTIDEFSSSNKENQEYIDNLNLDITNLKISVSSFVESELSLEEITTLIKNDIEANEKTLKTKKEKIEKSKEENIELENRIEKTKQDIEKIKEKVANSGETIERLKNDRTNKNEKYAQKEKEQTDQFKVIEDLKAQIVKMEYKKTKLDEDISNIINKMWEEYEITPNNIQDYQKPENVAITQKRVNNLRTDIKELGSVNVDSIEEYKNLKQRYDFMCEQRTDLEESMSKLRKVIQEMLEIMKQQFKEKFEIINNNFGQVFKELFGGGTAEVTLADKNNILECGIDITVQPPGKKLQSMTLLSGGEKAFTAIALLFAILKINPSPFCVLDEIEAALDDVNVYRYAEYLKKFSKETQFLIITHRKGTMEVADTVYGVTMEEKGISKLLSMKLKNT